MKRPMIAIIALSSFFLGFFSGASAGTLDATLTTKSLNDQTAQLEIRFAKPITDELLMWAWKLGFDQRISVPVKATSPGVYRFTAPMTEGVWRYYMRVGPGQAGYISRETFSVEKTETKTSFAMYNQFEDTVPTYIQPVGYAVWAVLLVFALGLVTVVLGRLSKRTQAV
jgi:hypothetical protein